MGLTVNTYCKRCRVAAPEIGDYGFIGSPTLGPRPRGGLTPFGEIYAGLAALRLVTPELDAFKAFLDAHRRHRIVQASDDDDADEEPPELAPFCHGAGRVSAGTYVEKAGDYVVSLDLATGRRRWTWHRKGHRIGGVHLCGDRLCLASDEGYYELDAATGAVVRHHDLESSLPDAQRRRQLQPILVSTTHIFGVLNSGLSVAFDRNSGRHVWSFRSGPCALHAANGRLYYGAGDRVGCLEP